MMMDELFSCYVHLFLSTFTLNVTEIRWWVLGKMVHANALARRDYSVGMNGTTPDLFEEPVFLLEKARLVSFNRGPHEYCLKVNSTTICKTRLAVPANPLDTSQSFSPRCQVYR